MSEDVAGGFAPLPFNPDNALVQMQRTLRDLRLTARGPAFELHGRRVVELVAADGTLRARVARKPALTPEFDTFSVASSAEQRRLLDEVRKRLTRWAQED